MAFDGGAERTVVIGAGINGLSAATTLAGQGRSVTLLERATRPGGMMATAGPDGVEIAHLVWNPGALERFSLSRDDLDLGPPLPLVAFGDDLPPVVVELGEARLADGGTHPDAAAYRAFRQRITRFAGVLVPLMQGPPPDLGTLGLSAKGVVGLMGLARRGIDLRRLGKADMREFLRILLSNVHDVILDEMPDGPLAATLGLEGVLGAKAGPRSPGTVLALLYRHAEGGERYRPAGGMAALAERLARAAERRGAEIRYGTEATGLEVEDDAVVGVRLANGERVEARTVLSSLGAEATLRLAGPQHFDAEACRRIRAIRAEGMVARLDLTLSKAPDFEGWPKDLGPARLLFAPSLHVMEQAFDRAKHGRLLEKPIVEAVAESDGHGHRLSLVVQHVPFRPEGGWTAEARDRLIRSVTEVLGGHANGLTEAVRRTALLVPPDIADATGAPGGHWHHGEFAADQMLTLRPAAGMAHYASGLPGLWFCGAGAHPGGDLTGLPGRNAALASLTSGVPA